MRIEWVSTHEFKPYTTGEITMSGIADRIANLKQLLTDLESDASKTDSGNKAAGTRVRKTLQEVVNESKEIRKAVIEARNNDS